MFNRTFPAPLPAIAFVPSHPVGRPPQQALTSGLLPAGAWSPFGRLCLLIPGRLGPAPPPQDRPGTKKDAPPALRKAPPSLRPIYKIGVYSE